jgi:hypothetical protein
MAYEHQENKGSLFKNDYKKADNHPDLKGTVNIEGKLFDIAAWKNSSIEGMLSLSVSVPYKKQPIRTESEKSNSNLKKDVTPF